jgi:hypothetical protein
MATAIESADQKENFSDTELEQKPLPFIPMWLDEYGLTAIEFRVYSHVLRRAGKTGKCWESVPRIARACCLGRNVTLKALHTLTNIYRLLSKNKRPGETDEYSIAHQSQWQPPVPQEDRLRRRIKKHPTDSSRRDSEPVPCEDGNVIELLNYQQEPDSSTKRQGEGGREQGEGVISPCRGAERNIGLFPSFLTSGSRSGGVESPSEPSPLLPAPCSLASCSNLLTASFSQTSDNPDSDDLTAEQTTLEAYSVEQPSIWRRNPDGTRYCQIPPIYNQATGVEIQHQMETEGRSAVAVVTRAIAISKAPKLILETLFAISQKLVNAEEAGGTRGRGEGSRGQGEQEVIESLLDSDDINSLSSSASCPPAPCPLPPASNWGDEDEFDVNEEETTGIPQQEWKYLKEIDIHLSYEVASQLWEKYSHKFTRAIAYVNSQEKKGKVQNRTAYFRACLSQGWIKDSCEKVQKRDPYELTQQQQEWYDWAVSVGLCDGRPIRHYGLMGAEVGMSVFDLEFQSNTIMPLSRAMQKYPKTVNH